MVLSFLLVAAALACVSIQTVDARRHVAEPHNTYHITQRYQQHRFLRATNFDDSCSVARYANGLRNRPNGIRRNENPFSWSSGNIEYVDLKMCTQHVFDLCCSTCTGPQLYDRCWYDCAGKAPHIGACNLKEREVGAIDMDDEVGGAGAVAKYLIQDFFNGRPAYDEEDSLGNTYMSNGHWMNSAGRLVNPS